VRTYVRDDEGRLVLNMWADAGNLFFRPVQAVQLEGSSWKLVSYHDGESALVSVLNGTEITAAFAESKLSGSAGCNNYFASYDFEGETLTLGPAATTRKMCAEPEGIMEQERAYLAALASVAGYRVEGERLELLDAEGALVATFEAAAPEIAGVTWQWQGTQTPVEEITVDAPERYTLELGPDGQVYVQADCNRLRGTYTLDDTHITIELTAGTRAACPADSLADEFVKELNAAAIHFTQGGELFIDLIYDSGTMRFARSE
jgi:heat shock protein HslJ